MTLVGFLGTDKTITLDKFKELVKKGEVKYVIVDGMMQPNGNNEKNSNREIANFDAYFRTSSFSRKWLNKILMEIMERQESFSVCRYKMFFQIT